MLFLFSEKLLGSFAIDLVRPFLECRYHLMHSLIKDRANQGLQQAGLELKINIEINIATAFSLKKLPVVFQILEWTILIIDINHHSVAVKRHATGVSFRNPLKSDDQIGQNRIVGSATYSGSLAPGQELRIFLNIRDKIKDLFGPMRHEFDFCVGRQLFEPSDVN